MLEKRKISTITIGYIIGILWGLYCKNTIVLFYLFLFTIYLLLKIFKQSKREAFKLLSFKRYSRYIKVVFTKKVIILIIITSIISNSFILIQNKNYENIYRDLKEEKVEIQGKIISVEKEKYKLKITSNKHKNKFLYLRCKEKLEYGNEVKIYGKYEIPNQSRNYKGFDYRNYLKTLKIVGTVNAQKVTIIQNNSINFFFTKINEFSLYLNSKIDDLKILKEEKAILKGILLGDKSEIKEDIVTDFSESNISHILAISGMHITYIILILKFLFNNLIGKHFLKVITSIVVFIYMCLTKFPVTLVRAGISGIVLIMSNFFYRKNDIWQSLSLSLIIILIYNPFAILNTGLQLSYSAIIGIIVFQKIFKKYIDDKLERINNKSIRKNKKKTKFVIKLFNSKLGVLFFDSLLLTISCTIMVIPITVYHYNSIAIFGILLSLFASFIIAPIIILGLVCLVFDFSFIQILLSYSLKILIFISKLGPKIHLNKIYIVTPNFFSILIYYFMVFLFFLIIKTKLEKKPSLFQIRVKNLINLAKYRFYQNKTKVISLILIVSIFFSFHSITPKDLKIYFLDVGQRRLHTYCNSTK